MHILIVEDNKVIANNVAEYLELDGHTCDVFHEGKRALEEALIKDYDMLILDRMLPGLDGLSIAKILQQKHRNIPFLFLTAKDKTTDKLEGLEIGADDYLVKPFDLEELTLRIKNIHKRAKECKGKFAGESVYNIDGVSIDLNAKQIKKGEQEITLSPKEFSILGYLLKNRGKIVTKQQIYEHAWDQHGGNFEAFSNTLTVHLSYIRKKLGNGIIRTVKLSGYIID